MVAVSKTQLNNIKNALKVQEKLVSAKMDDYKGLLATSALPHEMVGFASNARRALMASQNQLASYRDVLAQADPKTAKSNALLSDVDSQLKANEDLLAHVETQVVNFQFQEIEMGLRDVVAKTQQPDHYGEQFGTIASLQATIERFNQFKPETSQARIEQTQLEPSVDAMVREINLVNRCVAAYRDGNADAVSQYTAQLAEEVQNSEHEYTPAMSAMAKIDQQATAMMKEDLTANQDQAKKGKPLPSASSAASTSGRPPSSALKQTSANAQASAASRSSVAADQQQAAEQAKSEISSRSPK